MSITAAFAAHAAAARGARLPEEVVERTKMIVFDEIACAIVGRELPPGRAIAEWVAGQGGPPAAAVFGTAGRSSPVLAALANGTAGHADEFDGAHVTDGHPGAVIVHAVTAAGEALKSPGREVIAAISLAYDLGTRIVAAVGGAWSLRERHHVHSDHLHSYGAAAGCALLRGADADHHRRALALAAGNAGGLATVLEERHHMTKALANGIAAMSGVMAAELAAAGFDGSEAVLDSVHGPLAWAEAPVQDPGRGLGSEHAVMGANFKFYSAGYPIHAPAEAAMILMRDHGLRTGDIAAVTIGSNSRSLNTVGGRTMPSINIAHMVAVAMVHGDLGFDIAHHPTALNHPEVLRLKPLIGFAPDPELERTQPRGRGARVEIALRDGRRLSQLVEHPRGHARRGPVGWDELRGKWERLLPLRLGSGGYDRFLTACRGLESLEDIGLLARAAQREGA